MQDENKPTNTETDQTPKAPEANPTPKFSIEAVAAGGSSTPPTSKIQPYNKINTIMVVLLSITIVGLLAGGMYLYMQKRGLTNTTSNTPHSHSMLPPGISEPTGDTNVSINLEAISPFTGTASAIRSYTDGKFTISIKADTSTPADGEYYEAWINNDSQNPSYISLGRLNNMDGMYMLDYSTDQDITAYNSVFITEETESSAQDNQPEAHMFHGDF